MLLSSPPNEKLQFVHWLLLHGWAGEPKDLARVAERLSGQSAAPPLPGHGATPLTHRDATLEWVAESARALPRPRGLVGYSLGGRLGLTAWAGQPDLFDVGVLIGTHPGLRGDAERTERRALDRARARELRTDPATFFSRWDSQAMFSGRPARTRDLSKAEGFAKALVELSPGALPHAWDHAHAMRLAGRLVCVVGEHDEKFRRVLEPLDPVVVAGASHDVGSARPEQVAREAKRLVS